MEVTPANVEAMAGLLGQTLSGDAGVRRKAEVSLQSVETNEGYPRVLLRLVQTDAIAVQVRVSGAVMLKNFVKRNWAPLPAGETPKVADSDRQFLRDEVIATMLAAPAPVAKQLGEAISLVGRMDFPQAWPDLLQRLVAYFPSGNFAHINPVLLTADSLFYRYRHEMKSNELWLEIKLVLSQLAPALTELFQATLPLAQAAQNAPAAEAEPIFRCLVRITSIFYSLNSQDLPEFFEDNMGAWMPGFRELLKLAPASLKSDSEDEPGVVEELRSGICDVITLYAQRYEEEFSAHLPPFVELVWGLLTSTAESPSQDLLVSNAMSFLASVAGRDQYRSLFEAPGALEQICESVVVPNMQFRAADAEAFEDNPEEFIRKDIEGSDVDTRRRAAADLVKALAKFFEARITDIFGQYIKQLFAEYAADPAANWVRKDVGIYLVTSLAAKGGTARLGTTKTSELVDLAQFFQEHIGPELAKEDVNHCPVIKAACLKYLVTFRNQLDKATLVSGVASCARLATANSVVVHTYAAHALNRIFTIRNRDNHTEPLITADDVAPIAHQLLTNVFAIFQKPGSAENEYGMRALFRILIVLGPASASFAQQILEQLTRILALVAANPRNPYFSHYLFESLCVVLKQVSRERGTVASADLFEAAVFPPFTEILTKEVAEFFPYVFQILAMMLDLRPAGAGIPPPYAALLPHILIPVLWEQHGSVPALVRLLRAYLKVGAAALAANDQLKNVLGIFQKLVNSRLRDHEGFNLLVAFVEFVEPSVVRPQMKGVLTVLFGRLQASKTAKFTRCLIHALALIIIRLGGAWLVDVVDGIQAGLFGMLLEKLILAELQKVTGTPEKKVVSVGLTRLVTETEALLPGGRYGDYWSRIVESLIGLWELPEEESGEEEAQFIELEDQSYTASFAQLATASAPTSDPTGVEGDPKAFLAQKLVALNASRPVSSLLGQLQLPAQQFLSGYLNQAGLSL